MKYVLLYGTTACHDSLRARELLELRHIPYAEVDIAGDVEISSWLERTTGHRSIPQMFLGDRAIGGYTELCALDADGTLDAMLR